MSTVPRFPGRLERWEGGEAVRRVTAISPSMGPGIDTLEYAKRLRDAGFSERQAEGQAQALAAAMTDTLATRTDFDVLGSRIDGVDGRLGLRIDELEKRLDSRIGKLEKRLGTRIDALHERVGRLDERVGRLDDRFGALGERVGSLEQRCELGFAEMCSRTDLAHLERRMTMRLGGMMVAGIGVVSAVVGMI